MANVVPPDAIARFERIRFADVEVDVAITDASKSYWAEAAGGGWEPATLRFMARAIRPGTVFVDVGAWVGPLSLLAGKMGAAVIALEPDPVARKELVANLTRNGIAADVKPAALHTDNIGMTLHAPEGFGRSVSTSFECGGDDGEPVATISGEELAAAIKLARQAVGGDAPVVFKVDIEGHEHLIGPALCDLWRRFDAELHLSLHPRSIWAQERAARGDLAARWRAYKAMTSLLCAFRGGRIQVANAPSMPLKPACLFQAFRTPRPKNFTVEVGRPAR
ncbi:MAG: FkbM family methyltransferase [Pseudomonadota bacterium]